MVSQLTGELSIIRITAFDVKETITKDITVNAKYEEIAKVDVKVNSSVDVGEGKRKVSLTVTTTFNSNVDGLKVVYVANSQPSSENPLVYTMNQTETVSSKVVTKQMQIFYSIPGINGSRPIDYSYEAGAQTEMYNYTYEDMEGATHKFQAERGSSTWFKNSPLASFIDPQTAETQGTAPTMSADGSNVFLGWKTNVTGSDSLLYWSGALLTNLLANKENAVFEPVVGYPVNLEYETFEKQSNGFYVPTENQITETYYTMYNSTLDKLNFNVNYLPHIPSPIRNADGKTIEVEYKWVDQYGKTWTEEELSIHSDYTEPLNLTGTIEEKEAEQPSEYDREYPLYQIYDGKNELKVTEEYILKQLTTLGGTDFSQASSIDVTLNA